MSDRIDPHDGKTNWDIAVENNQKSPSSFVPAPGSPMSFHLTQEQTDKFAVWSKGRIGGGAIGGRITVSFTGTSIGTVVIARDQQTGQEIDLSDYDDW